MFCQIKWGRTTIPNFFKIESLIVKEKYIDVYNINIYIYISDAHTTAILLLVSIYLESEMSRRCCKGSTSAKETAR